MALIICPECGKEISDQAQMCIHCGYPLQEARADHYALVLDSLNKNYSGIIRTLQDQLQIDSYSEAKALADSVPVVLKRDMTYDACKALAECFQADACVKMVLDKGQSEAALLEDKESRLLPQAEAPSGGMTFGGTVAAVVLGVIAAILLLSFL